MPSQLLLRSKEQQGAAITFDYGQFAKSVREHIESETRAIQRMLGKASSCAVQIGLRLRVVRDAIGREQFQPWLKSEFSWTQSTASRYMRAARAFENVERLENIQPSALYVLSQKNAPASARDEALRLARSGEFVTRDRARSIVARLGQGNVRRSHSITPDRIRRQVLSVVQKVSDDEAILILEDLLRTLRNE